MVIIYDQLQLRDSEIEVTSIKAQGPGGQNVNKVASAIHLRFDILSSSLPENIKQRLLNSKDYRISRKGILVIKAQRYRTRERNLEDAYNRLRDLILSAHKKIKKRIKTRPTVAVKQRRQKDKTRRSKVKQLRKKVGMHE